MVQWFDMFTRTMPLTRSEWGACVVAGSTVLLIAALLKMTGTALTKRIPFTKFVDEDKEGVDQLVQSINKYSNVQVNMPEQFRRGRGKKSKQSDGYDEMDDYKNFNNA